MALCVHLRCCLSNVLRHQVSNLHFRLRGDRLKLCVTSLASSGLLARRFFHDRNLQRFRQTTATMNPGERPTSINFQDYDVYGFDLDHTITKYKLVALFKLAYKCVTDFLVHKRDYDPSIKEGLSKYKDFICKGLFLDINKGNILKLGHDGTILRATHGTRLLPQADIQQIYGKDMKWKHTETVKQTLRNSPSVYRFFENYFDCPGLVATARIIDMIDEKHLEVAEREKLYTKAWEDTLQALVHMYTPGDGGDYFPTMQKDTGSFVEKCSEDIRRWLKSLRQQGKMVFLLTNSEREYATFLLEECLGKDWQSYFDLSLFRGRKPGFFTENYPFYALDGNTEGQVVTDLERHGCYSQGNTDGLKKFLSKELGKEDVKVLYFGDNICSDCYPTRHFAQWGNVLILEEMDAEGYLCSDGTVPGHERDAAKKRKVIEHSSLVTDEEISYLLTEFWGPFLVHQEDESASPVEMNTFWGDIVGRYCDIAVPSLEYLAGVPLDHSFDTFLGSRTSLGGFHPGRPSSLLP